jgi:predicted transcriptional regulator YdeE
MTQLMHHEIIEHKACKIVGRTIRTTALSKDIPALWEKCFAEDLFKQLIKPENITDDLHPDTIGAMYGYDGDMFNYIVGTFLKSDASCEGYDFVDFPAGKAIITWIQGPIPQLYGEAPNLTEAKLLELGLTADYSTIFGIEIYTLERFVAEQEKGQGNAILDYLIPLK